MVKTFAFLLCLVFSAPCWAFSSHNLSTNSPMALWDTTVFPDLQPRLGLNLAWEYPYATGIELSFCYKEIIDFNTGLGLGLSGFKFGFGARFYPLPNKKVSPLIGTYIFTASGVDNVNVYINEDEAQYKITADNAVLINGGLRVRFRRGNYLLGAIGYSIPFKGDKAVYKSGSTKGSLNDFADAFATGGFAMHVGYYFRLGKKSNR